MESKTSNAILLHNLNEDDLVKRIVSEVTASVLKAMESKIEEKLLDVTEACQIFQPSVSRQTLSSWTRAGYLVAKKIGGKNYYKLSDLLTAGTTLKLYKR